MYLMFGMHIHSIRSDSDTILTCFRNSRIPVDCEEIAACVECSGKRSLIQTHHMPDSTVTRRISMTRTARKSNRRTVAAPELPVRPQPFRVSLVYPDTVAAGTIAESLKEHGIEADVYMTGREFLRDANAQSPGVVLVKSSILDLTMQEVVSGMSEFSIRPLVIACPNHATIPDAINLLEHGVSDILIQADNPNAVLEAVTRAYRAWYELDAEDVEALAETFEKGYERLTAREMEVLELVVKGGSSRAIAATLGVSTKTIEAHRARIHAKMRTDDVGHLVRMWRAGME